MQVFYRPAEAKDIAREGRQGGTVRREKAIGRKNRSGSAGMGECHFLNFFREKKTNVPPMYAPSMPQPAKFFGADEDDVMY